MTMTIRDDSRNRVLYVSSDILRYRRVEKISDYLKIKARRASSNAGTELRKRDGLVKRWHAMSGLYKMTLIIAICTVIGMLATITSLFLTVW
jgi:hypothetical protein